MRRPPLLFLLSFASCCVKNASALMPYLLPYLPVRAPSDPSPYRLGRRRSDQAQRKIIGLALPATGDAERELLNCLTQHGRKSCHAFASGDRRGSALLDPSRQAREISLPRSRATFPLAPAASAGTALSAVPCRLAWHRLGSGGLHPGALSAPALSAQAPAPGSTRAARPFAVCTDWALMAVTGASAPAIRMWRKPAALPHGMPPATR